MLLAPFFVDYFSFFLSFFTLDFMGIILVILFALVSSLDWAYLCLFLCH